MVLLLLAAEAAQLRAVLDLGADGLPGPEMRVEEPLVFEEDLHDPQAPAGLPVEVLSATGAVLDTGALPPITGWRSVITPDGHERARVPDTHIRFAVPWPEGADALRIAGHRIEVDLTPRVWLTPPEPAEAVHSSGSSLRRLDLLILAEGFTAAERPAFDAEVERVTRHLRRLDPYNDYGDLLNVWKVFVPSADSGVDPSEPTTGTGLDTPFECHLGCKGIERLMCCDEPTIVLTAHMAVVGYDGVLLLANTSSYGGSGGASYAVSYTGDQAEQVAAHELAHSLIVLWDEYTYDTEDTDGPPSHNCAPADEPVPWQSWIDRDHPEVGAFPGCTYTNRVRSTLSSCMMLTLQDRFCPICREQIVRAMYREVGGPIETTDPPSSEVVRLRAGESRVFQATTLEPKTGLEWEWVLDQELVSTTPYAFTLDGCGNHRKLELTVRDPTERVRDDPHGYLESSVNWKVRTERCEGDPYRCGCAHRTGPELLGVLLGLAARRRSASRSGGTAPR